jgi:hypothetical protein
MEAALGDVWVRWDEAGAAVEAFEAGEGVGPFSEGAYDYVAAVADEEGGGEAFAAAASGVDDTERRQVAF